ncbi:PhnE/PtxC family ABC transporter permease [Leptolyngbya sp. AN02str]|uniref:PhnE/PtxC family ABC transporter permease n=1 Tax=Leptolyngbya sp. AN02str TaxID=3423363 RepID=UPI003D31DB3F
MANAPLSPMPTAPAKPPFWTPATRWMLVALVAIALSLIPTGVFLGNPIGTIVNPGGLPQLWSFVRASLHPDLSLEFAQLTVQATLTTLVYAVCGTTLSVAFGLVGGVLMSEVWWQAVFSRQPRPIWNLLRGLLAVPRAIHELIWGLFFVNIFGLDPLVAILGIAIPYGAIVAKVFSELLDETPRQSLQALVNSGVAPGPAFLYTLLPQAFLDLLSYTFYRFECSIRSAAVLGIIGAGGLGYEILLSLQSLRYEQLWTLFYALFSLNGSVDVASAVLRRRLGSPSRLDLNLKRRTRRSPQPSISSSTAHTPLPAPPSALHPAQASLLLRHQLWQHLPAIALGGVALLIPISFWTVGADFSKLWSPRTGALLADIVQAATPLHITLAEATQLVRLSLQTLAMSIVAIALAGIGGVVLSFPAAHNFFLPGGLFGGSRNSAGQRAIAWGGLVATRLVLLVCRAIPAPIWALVTLFVLFPGILPGAIALGLHNLGILGRLMAEVTENLDQRPLLALKAQGAPAVPVFLYGVLPLTLTRFLAYILYRWEVCMRETVIVGLVGAGGLGRLLTEQLSSFNYQGLVVSLGGFVLLTLAVDTVSGAVRRSLR